MTKTLVFGHKSPDTDTICSAIAYAELKQALGVSAEAARLGEINAETEFALNYFHVAPPRFVESVAGEADEVILVDHNERQQSASDIDKVQVVEVIDHHRIANFETKSPLYYRAEPVGCTATILNKLFKEHQVAIRREIAGLLVSCIVSDTLLLKSPTCTPEDVAAAKELADIAGVNLEEYGLAMLKAGADLSKKTADQLVSLDAKEFPMGSYKVVIAQVNTVDVAEVLKRQADIEASISKVVSDKQLDLFVFVITDILNSDSVGIILGRVAKAVEQAYHVSLDHNRAALKGVVSRKKQIVPILTEVLANYSL